MHVKDGVEHLRIQHIDRLGYRVRPVDPRTGQTLGYILFRGRTGQGWRKTEKSAKSEASRHTDLEIRWYS